jgi:hypothetical protein
MLTNTPRLEKQEILLGHTGSWSLNSSALITNPTACSSLKDQNATMLIKAQRMCLRDKAVEGFSTLNLEL